MTGLDPNAVYDKIDFIHRQCLRFAGDRERRLEHLTRRSLTLCVDAQDYMVNWRRRTRRKNIQFSALCTVEAKSRYVLAHTMNYDPDIAQIDVEDEARIHGDLDPGRKSYFRASPQYWLESEFDRMAGEAGLEIRPNIEAEPLYIDDLIDAVDQWEADLPDPESPDVPCRGNQMPHAGVMTHVDCTAYAHALLVERFTQGAKYVTIYTDESAMLANAYLTAFAERIRAGRGQMAFVQFQKQMTIDERRDLARIANRRVARLAAQFKVEEPLAMSRAMAWRYAQLCASVREPAKRWVEHPRDTINEPRRRILYLTDDNRRTLTGIGWTLFLATLAPVDTYFMRLRRKIYYLERPVPTRANASRMWSGYHAYDPKRVVQPLDIFRVYTNFVWSADGKETAAMRLGLTKGKIRFEDILYYMPDHGARGADEPEPMAAE